MKNRKCAFSVVLLACLCVSTVSGCGYSGTPPTPKPVPAAPAITQQPASVMVVVGQPATFSVVATGTAPLSYQWYMNGTAAGTNSNLFSIAQTTAGQIGRADLCEG